MSSASLKAEGRKLEHSKGELNKLRREGKVPAVLFSKGRPSEPLFVDLVEFKKTINHGGKIFELKLTNGAHLVNAKHIETDPLGKISHIGFHELERNQVTTVQVPIVTVGNAPGVKTGGLVHVLLETLDVTGLPNKIPESIEVDVSNLELDAVIKVGELKLAQGLTIEDGADEIVLNCHMPKEQAEAETEATSTMEESIEAIDSTATENAGAEASEDEKKAG